MRTERGATRLLPAIALSAVVGLTLAGAPLSTPPSPPPDASAGAFTRLHRAVSGQPVRVHHPRRPPGSRRPGRADVGRDLRVPPRRGRITRDVRDDHRRAGHERPVGRRLVHGLHGAVDHRPLRPRLHRSARHRTVPARPVRRGRGRVLPVRRRPGRPGPARPGRRGRRAVRDDCVAESGVADDDLPFYATAQAVEDLEAIRQHLGIDQFVLYGESYGTQYAQTYAAAHPEHVSMLVLDGVVDLTVDALDYYEEGARAHDDALRATLAACTDDEPVPSTSGVTPLPPTTRWPGASPRVPSATTSRCPTARSSPDVHPRRSRDRGGGQHHLAGRPHAVAAGGGRRGRGRPRSPRPARLRRGGRRPRDPGGRARPGWSDAMYYAVECQDYEFLPADGTPRQRLDAGSTGGGGGGRRAAPGVGLLRRPAVPVLAPPAQERSPPRPDRRPAVPDAGAHGRHRRTDARGQRDARLRPPGRLLLVLLEGGPHVIFDWGYRASTTSSATPSRPVSRPPPGSPSVLVTSPTRTSPTRPPTSPPTSIPRPRPRSSPTS